MKKIGKFSFYAMIGFALFSFGYLLGFWSNFYYLSYKFDPVRLSNKQISEDIYGGKTPEETYGLFVLALTQGNIELASKYFIIGKQDEKLEEFKKIKEKNELQKYIDDLPKWGEMREVERVKDNIREFNYKGFSNKEIMDNKLGIEIRFPAGEYTSSIIFKLNSSTKIWKIDIF